MQHPVSAFPRPVGPPGDFDETVVEAKVVSQGVLPSLGVASVVGKPLDDEPIDLAEGQHFVGRAPDGHGCQGDVGVGGLLVPVRLPAGSRHSGAIDARRWGAQAGGGRHRCGHMAGGRGLSLIHI